MEDVERIERSGVRERSEGKTCEWAGYINGWIGGEGEFVNKGELLPSSIIIDFRMFPEEVGVLDCDG